MNELIEKFIAESTICQGHPQIDGSYFDKEKFAELIVRECVAVLIRHHPYTTDPEAYHYAISLIEEHFGVE